MAGFRSVIVCGQQSLAVFCVGVFLSFVGHFELMLSSGSLFAQIFVSVTGIAIMTIVAYYISWSKRQDKPPQAGDHSRQGSLTRSLIGPTWHPPGAGRHRAGVTNLPFDENSPHSVDQPTASRFRFP